MQDIMLGAGIACMAAAVIGGGLKAFGMEIPLFSSLGRQVILFALGGALTAFSVNLPDPKSIGDIQQQPPATGSGKPASEAPPPPPPTPKAIKTMGPLQVGINLQGNDYDAFGKQAENAQLCAEMCRTDENCKAMTYVISLKRCWLKPGVPPASANPDMISSIAQYSDTK